MMPWRLLVLVGAMLLGATSYAYELGTHNALSLAALKASRLGFDASFRLRAGFLRDVTDRAQTVLDSQTTWGSIADVVSRAAEYEDSAFPYVRSKHHFFDPSNDSPLYIDRERWTSVGRIYSAQIVQELNGSAKTSPDWMLVVGNGNSYTRDGLTDAMWGAYTLKVPRDRAIQMGLTFDILGRMVHHLQDMAQPQHVRNDLHLHSDLLTSLCKVNWVEHCLVYRDLDNQSVYEAWTLATAAAQRLATTYPTPYGLNDAKTFNVPRRFWKHEGKGMAEFTSRNFYSAGTLSRYPPVETGTQVIARAQDLCAGVVPPCMLQDPNGSVTFKTTSVTDSLHPDRGGTIRAAALSIYSEDFERVTGRQPVWTVNRFVFDDQHRHLLPRAIAYSAGFIDYVFRGDMEITPPNEQVYAVSDTTVAGCGNPCGFKRVKLKLRNITPGNEAMAAGKLRAVALYRRNTCYRADLSGNPGGPHFLGNQCRGAEEVSVSKEVKLSGTLSRTTPKLMTFDFSADPIPMNATEVRIQVVFRGKLGAEADAVAVSTLDTAEPTFVAFGNTTDYVFDHATQRYVTASSVQDAGFPVSALRVGFATPGGSPVATLAELKEGQHAQIAVLANKRGVSVWAQDSGLFQRWELNDPGMEEFWFDEATSQYRASCPVWEMRGPHRQWVLHFYRQTGGPVRTSSAKYAGGARERVETMLSKASEIACEEAPLPGSGGPWDLSAMTPKFTTSSAKRFTIKF